MQITETQIKNMAKEIVKLTKENNPVKHSAVLETVAISFGFKDYNALSPVLKETVVETKEAKPQSPFNPMTLDKIIEKRRGELEEKYPPLDKEIMVTLDRKNGYEFFIYAASDGENEESYRLDVLVCLNKSITKRVFYSIKNESFALFVYPDIKDAYDSFDIYIGDIATENLYEDYFKTMNLLQEKREWMSSELHSDTVELMEFVKRYRKELKREWETTNKEKLRTVWKEHSRGFSQND